MRWIPLLLILLVSACLSPSTEEMENAATSIAGEETEPSPPGEVCMRMEDVESETERCLVVVEGKVYDLTDTDVWGFNRLHSGELECGKDHTSALSQMPHGRSLFTEYEIAELCP